MDYELDELEGSDNRMSTQMREHLFDSVEFGSHAWYDAIEEIPF